MKCMIGLCRRRWWLLFVPVLGALCFFVIYNCVVVLLCAVVVAVIVVEILDHGDHGNHGDHGD